MATDRDTVETDEESMDTDDELSRDLAKLTRENPGRFRTTTVVGEDQLHKYLAFKQQESYIAELVRLKRQENSAVANASSCCKAALHDPPNFRLPPGLTV